MMTATYSPEDSKLRLYSDVRLSAETYARVKAAGFKWAPKQELFVAPMWTPAREDLLLELCGEIDDEDYSPEERSADRAERFGNYRDKRVSEAGHLADRFDSGPVAFGHQSRARAERQAVRHDRNRTGAVSQWGKAEYWQARTTAVIRHALYKSSAAVRRSRILRLEAEQRKQNKTNEEYAKRFRLWSKVPTLEGADVPLAKATESGYSGIATGACTPAGKLAYALANYGSYGSYVHPRNPDRKTSLYSLLSDEIDPITPREAAALWLENRAEPAAPGQGRWEQHYENRLNYERAMLAVEGGSASEADMERGGWIGNRQIHKVNKSPVTGRVVSVTLKIEGDRWGNTREGFHLRAFNVERLPEGAYRGPTDEEREAFKTATAERKAAEKAGKPKPPALVNPTDADAQKLQDRWNEQAKARHAELERKGYGPCPVSEVWRMTQAEYSKRSKGSYSTCEASDVSELLTVRRPYRSERSRETVFKVRTAGGVNYAARRVIVLTDKPQKPLPWSEVETARAKQPTEETVFPRLGELVEALGSWNARETDTIKQLIRDAAYVGWAYSSSMTQRGLTEAGAAAHQRFQETAETAGVV